MLILAIETSCDETAAAVVRFEKNKAEVLSSIVSSQVKMHGKYGGVVPSLASRLHLKNMIPVLGRTFEESKIGKGNIDYIAVTKGPGLIPALMIGVNAARALSYAWKKPLIGVNHLEGHIYANWLRLISKSKVESRKSKVGHDNIFDLWKPEFPVLCLIVSGGHTELVLMKKDLDYKIIGETLDDAAGEAFDKIAKLLDLGYPGGPLVEKLARKGNKNRFNFPRPMINSKNHDFSFSGLKTAVLYEIRSKKENDDHLIPGTVQKLSFRGVAEKSKRLEMTKTEFLNGLDDKKSAQSNRYKTNMAASFQQAALDVLIAKTCRAAKEYKVKNIILGGGVSANKELQNQLEDAAKKQIPLSAVNYPPAILTTDNALMIAVATHKHIIDGRKIGNWRNVKADANLRLK